MAKAKPFKGASAPSLAGRGPADEITRAQLVALVAARVPRGSGDDERSVRNRISASVYEALKTDTLRKARPGVFRLGDVGIWARAKWPGGQFSDVPVSPSSGGASLALSGYRVTAAGYTHATTLQAASEEVLALRAEKRALEQALAAAEAQVRELEPDACKWRSSIDKKRGKRRR
jgi:hypothetical protein